MLDFAYNHPRMILAAFAASLIAIFILFLWNIVLSYCILKKRSGMKMVEKTECIYCGCEKISVVRQSMNEGGKLLNVCQECGKSWLAGSKIRRG